MGERGEGRRRGQDRKQRQKHISGRQKSIHSLLDRSDESPTIPAASCILCFSFFLKTHTLDVITKNHSHISCHRSNGSISTLSSSVSHPLKTPAEAKGKRSRRGTCGCGGCGGCGCCRTPSTMGTTACPRSWPRSSYSCVCVFSCLTCETDFSSTRPRAIHPTIRYIP